MWFEVRRLSHHTPWSLPVIRVLLPIAAPPAFQIQYSVHCDELLDPTDDGVVNVILAEHDEAQS